MYISFDARVYTTKNMSVHKQFLEVVTRKSEKDSRNKSTLLKRNILVQVGYPEHLNTFPTAVQKYKSIS